MYHKLKTVLYHGTVSEIKQVDVTLGRGRKDFGRGFYMAVSKSQAVGMMHKKYKETIRRSHGNQNSVTERLYEITLDKATLSGLNIKVFEEADLEWLEFVLMCREQGGMPHDYDVVVGPTADDDTAVCLKAYGDGLYGRVGTAEAKKILLKNLEVENLGIQYFVGKQEIADKLISGMKEVDWR